MKTKNKTKVVPNRLVNKIDRDLHMALLCIQNREQGMLDWCKLDKGLFLVSAAAIECERAKRLDKLNVKAAMLTIEGISSRKKHTGTWGASENDLVLIVRGILSAENLLSEKDILKTLSEWGTLQN